jgi:haloalkane dehalogenase
MSMHRRSLSRAEKRAYLYPYGNWNDRVAVNAFVKDIPMSAEDPSWETLKSVEGDLGKLSEKEICLVWGGKDFCFNKSFFDEFQRRFPRARTRYLDWAGHYVLEDAVEETREELKSFLLG